MARHFPIFIDLGGTPPLVVGAQPALSAKLRLLIGFAPRVELLTGLQKVPSGLALPGVHHIDGISLGQAAKRFRGRSLVLIDTGDPALDEMLSLRARRIGVPVNVPDKPALCSFYLGSIVGGSVRCRCPRRRCSRCCLAGGRGTGIWRRPDPCLNPCPAARPPLCLP